jgi:hypothetical protein
MAAGCAEAHEPETGVWTPRSLEAFESTEGVKRGAESAEERRPGRWPWRRGDSVVVPSTDHGKTRVHITLVLGLDDFRPDLFLVQETAFSEKQLPLKFRAEAAGRRFYRKARDRFWGRALYAGRGAIRRVGFSEVQC